jgi:UDP-glucose 4-epimerase
MDEERWQGTNVLITGGAGFIGSNLSRALVGKCANVTILDQFLQEYGSNTTNLEGIDDQIQIIEGDVRDLGTVTDAVSEADVVFHLASQLSRTVSNEQPSKDIEINCVGTMNVLQAASNRETKPRVVFTSSQAVIGQPPSIPITEETRSKPIDVYGANKRASEHYADIFHRVHEVPTVVFRLTNVYGPRAQLNNPNYGVINRFIRLALQDETLPVFQPGEMTRDFVYVDDVVRALLKGGISHDVVGERYIVGSGTGTSIIKLANLIVTHAGKGDVELVSWPEEWDSIRIGDLVSDPAKLQRDTGWEPKIKLTDGVKQMLSYYEEHIDSYL